MDSGFTSLINRFNWFEKKLNIEKHVNIWKYYLPSFITFATPLIMEFIIIRDSFNYECIYVSSTRPFPGYGGFVPKLPVIPSPQQDLPLMQSTYGATYGWVVVKILSLYYLGEFNYSHKNTVFG